MKPDVTCETCNGPAREYPAIIMCVGCDKATFWCDCPKVID
jgi:hypothetical protein